MVHVRPARREDHPAYARLFPELEVPDSIPGVDAWWPAQGPTTLIAEDDLGRVVGYGFYERVGITLYVRNVVSAPEARRTGVGRALLQAMVERGRATGATRWCLNVKEDNLPALRLYESMGLRVAYPTRVLRVPWTLLSSLPRSQGRVRTPLPGEDARIEAELSLMGGQVQRQRELARVLLVAFDPEEAPIGLASFDPGFPGCFPFRAREVAVAGALLEALVPYRRTFPEGDWRAGAVQWVVEGQEDVADALEQLGAQRVFRILHLAGELRLPGLS